MVISRELPPGLRLEQVPENIRSAIMNNMGSNGYSIVQRLQSQIEQNHTLNNSDVARMAIRELQQLQRTSPYYQERTQGSAEALSALRNIQTQLQAQSQSAPVGRGIGIITRIPDELRPRREGSAVARTSGRVSDAGVPMFGEHPSVTARNRNPTPAPTVTTPAPTVQGPTIAPPTSTERAAAARLLANATAFALNYNRHYQDAIARGSGSLPERVAAANRAATPEATTARIRASIQAYITSPQTIDPRTGRIDFIDNPPAISPRVRELALASVAEAARDAGASTMIGFRAIGNAQSEAVSPAVTRRAISGAVSAARRFNEAIDAANQAGMPTRSMLVTTFLSPTALRTALEGARENPLPEITVHLQSRPNGSTLHAGDRALSDMNRALAPMGFTCRLDASGENLVISRRQ